MTAVSMDLFITSPFMVLLFQLNMLILLSVTIHVTLILSTDVFVISLYKLVLMILSMVECLNWLP